MQVKPNRHNSPYKWFRPLLLLLACALKAIADQSSNSPTASRVQPRQAATQPRRRTRVDNAGHRSPPPQGHKSVAAWFHFLSQAPQRPHVVQKRSSRGHCHRGRPKHGSQTAGSPTREKLTTGTNFQLSFHRPPMSTCTRLHHKGHQDRLQ